MIQQQITPIRPGKLINTLLSSEPLRVLIGQFIATTFLLFMATSVATLPPYQDHPYDPNKYRLVYVAIIVYVIICFFGPITGAHVNPAVSLAIFLSRKNRKKHIKVLIAYWVAQFLGGLLGVILSRNIYGNGGAVFEEMPEATDLIRLCLQQFGATFLFIFFILLLITQQTTFVYDQAWVHLTLGIVYYLCLTLSSKLHFLNPAVATSLQFQAMLQTHTNSHGLPAIFAIIVVEVIACVAANYTFRKVYMVLLLDWRKKLMED